MLDGEYGMSDVCLGVPIRIGKDGVMNIQEIDLEKSELSSLKKSAEVVKSYLLQQIC